MAIVADAGPALPKASATTVFTFTDEMGTEFTFPQSPKRLVVLTAYPAEVLYALGAGDRIVGICNPENEFLPEMRHKQSVGKSAVNPNLERIYELSPDLVIAYQWTKKDVIEQLEKWDIPVACCRVWTMNEADCFI